eukprot:comp21621_c0_seq1/m.47694 comp21621_c0_seq1/g.47694  ORF comp21621_c0_seq1/g.47694 comp21621_c0_seq1/m.47694 type:complete len:370 (-) comp21621_c0_seq1:1636-2745(-)
MPSLCPWSARRSPAIASSTPITKHWSLASSRTRTLTTRKCASSTAQTRLQSSRARAQRQRPPIPSRARKLSTRPVSATHGRHPSAPPAKTGSSGCGASPLSCSRSLHLRRCARALDLRKSTIRLLASSSMLDSSRAGPSCRSRTRTSLCIILKPLFRPQQSRQTFCRLYSIWPSLWSTTKSPCQSTIASLPHLRKNAMPTPRPCTTRRLSFKSRHQPQSRLSSRSTTSSSSPRPQSVFSPMPSRTRPGRSSSRSRGTKSCADGKMPCADTRKSKPRIRSRSSSPSAAPAVSPPLGAGSSSRSLQSRHGPRPRTPHGAQWHPRPPRPHGILAAGAKCRPMSPQSTSRRSRAPSSAVCLRSIRASSSPRAD